MSSSRRSFVRSVGSAAAVGATASVAIGSGSRPARAAEWTHPDNSPEHVHDPVFDEALLEKYKPRLLTHDLKIEPSAIYGFVVRSNEYDTTALVYFTQYPKQQDSTGYASHMGDHEPFHVYIENEGLSSERIHRVVYSAYHWMADETISPPTTTGDNTGRPRAYAVRPYHHYSLDVAENDPRAGEDIELRDLVEYLPRWLDMNDSFREGLAEDWEGRGSPPYNPWIMLDKPSWWRVDGMSNYDEFIRSVWLLLGIRGADSSDLG